MLDYYLTPCKKQTPKKYKIYKPIFNDIDLIVPVGTGKTSSF
jgi:hypothetical protein